MNKNFQPNDQFVENLEWQLSSEFRRASRLQPSPGKIAIPRRMVAIAVAIGVLMTGVPIDNTQEGVYQPLLVHDNCLWRPLCA